MPLHIMYHELEFIAANFLFKGLSGDFIHSFLNICLSCDSLAFGFSIFSWGNLIFSNSSYAAFIRFSGCLSTAFVESFILNKMQKKIKYTFMWYGKKGFFSRIYGPNTIQNNILTSRRQSPHLDSWQFPSQYLHD